jgi:hypothetical protein
MKCEKSIAAGSGDGLRLLSTYVTSCELRLDVSIRLSNSVVFQYSTLLISA